MKCPRCNTLSFQESVYEGFKIDKCTSCEGVWLSTDTLVDIIETKEASFSAQAIRKSVSQAFQGIPLSEQETHLACPVCNDEMKSVNFATDSGVIIDNCDQGHGSWFDKGELSKAQQYREYWDKSIDENEKFFLSTLEKEYDPTNKHLNDQSALFVFSTAIGTLVDNFLNTLHRK